MPVNRIVMIEASAESAAVNRERVNTTRAVVVDGTNLSFMDPSLSHAAAAAHRRKYAISRWVELVYVPQGAWAGNAMPPPR